MDGPQGEKGSTVATRTINRDNLNHVMEFDHVILVYASGYVETDVAACWAPELHPLHDDEGSHLAETDADLQDQARRQGWSLLTGWTGQHGYSGPCMHQSEYIGGRLADHILTTPGYWVAVVIENDPEDPAPSWALAHREAPSVTG